MAISQALLLCLTVLSSAEAQSDNGADSVSKTTATTATETRPLMVYVGTFSSPLQDVLPTQVDLPPGNGRGIHIFEMDRESGKLTARGEYRSGVSPSHLAVNAAGTRIYSANETDRIGNPKTGSISSFEVNQKTGELTLLNTVSSGGAGPTNVHVHPSGHFLLVANYFGGSVAVLPILEHGQLGEATHIHEDQGEIGPTVSTSGPPGSFAFSGHDRTHAHQILTDPSGEFVLHVDLGLDTIYVWKLDQKLGKLIPAKSPHVKLPPGDGPRYLAFHPDGKWMYSIQEEGSTVVLFDFDRSTGKLTARQTLSTLPENYAGSNFCSGILLSKDAKHVYCGNRLHDSIGIFKIGDDGKLTHVGEEWTRGNYPRSFSIDPSGEFLNCCNQRADHVTTFRIDPETGSLKFTGQYTPVGNPSCVLYLDLSESSSN